jgi:hypothetical protein
MYSRNGTTVRPFWPTRPTSSAISARWRSSFRSRRGSWRDRGADQPGLTALDPGVGVAQVDLAAADALDLRAREDEARLERVVDVVLVTGLAVEGDRLFRQGNGSLEAANGAGAGERVADAQTRRTHKRRPLLWGRRQCCFTTRRWRLGRHLRGGAATVTITHCTSPPFVRDDDTGWPEALQAPRLGHGPESGRLRDLPAGSPGQLPEQ